MNLAMQAIEVGSGIGFAIGVTTYFMVQVVGLIRWFSNHF